MSTNGIYYSQISGLTFSTDSVERLIISTGGTSTFSGITSGSTIVNVKGSQGQLFEVDDDMSGDILAVTDSGGNTIFAVNTYDPMRIVGLTANTSTNFLVVDNTGKIGYNVSGMQGTSGLSGISGTLGNNGNSGLSGISGLSGLSGTGPQGISGISGLSGISGTSGISGLSGVSGRSGISGLSGISGTSGISGLSGISGTSGISGLSGISGTVGATGGGLTWNNATTSQPMVAGNGYITTASTLTTFTLPSPISLGQTVVAYGNSTGLWQINQTAGQSIRIGNSTTTAATNALSATSQGDCVYLVGTSSNTFIVVSSIGNIYFT